MIHALGYSQTPFQPDQSGRLCRGRDRWIEPWETDGEVFPTIHRLVFSGAAFSDDSAADAQRGVPYSGIEVATLITTLFPRKDFVAWMEDGHPADIPADAERVEAYEAHRGGGTTESGVVVRGFCVVDSDEAIDLDGLADALFALSGFSTLDSPPAFYQPLALNDVLAHVKAVVLLHRDKHGPAVGVYMAEPMSGVEPKVAKLCEKAGALLVPFAIPPMLARWDRAIAELRQAWMQSRSDEFPVPAAAEGPGWDRRRRRDRRRSAPEATEE